MPDSAQTSQFLSPAFLEAERTRLQTTKYPILTVSASFREDLKGWYGQVEDETLRDIVFSRAHYSMAMAVANAAWHGHMDDRLAWVADPVNFVSPQQWRTITTTEKIGKVLARNSILKGVKDVVDKFGRQKLPILESIRQPLLELTKGLDQPIISLHIATGNILAERGHRVVQVVTDPHVRYDYLAQAQRENIVYCVFDNNTRWEFLEKAVELGKKVNPARVIVTGPPIDPVLFQMADKKRAWRPDQPCKILLTTGGLGTNKAELLALLEQYLSARRKLSLQVMVYAGTHADILDAVLEVAEQKRIKPLVLHTVTHPKTTLPHHDLTIIHHPQIVDANQLLFDYGFPWADIIVTKPSGDMAYDAAAAGAALLTLQEWGEWEHNIRALFSQHGVSRRCLTEHAVDQLSLLLLPEGGSLTWLQSAQKAASALATPAPQGIAGGAENILKTTRFWS